MKVKAIGVGQYKNRIIERGQVFELDNEAQFSHRWMVKILEPVIPVDPESSDHRKPENADDRKAIDEQLQAEKWGLTK